MRRVWLCLYYWLIYVHFSLMICKLEENWQQLIGFYKDTIFCYKLEGASTNNYKHIVSRTLRVMTNNILVVQICFFGNHCSQSCRRLILAFETLSICWGFGKQFSMLKSFGRKSETGEKLTKISVLIQPYFTFYVVKMLLFLEL